MKLSRILTPNEYRAMDEEGVAKGFWRGDPRIFTPGMMWEQPWWFDRTGELERNGEHVIISLADKGKLGLISIHYWNDWADKRYPICVVCPNGETWEIDRKSSNGDGWKVTGEGLNITVRPSINAIGYHGWLTDGEFSADLEGRGPNGTPRAITERVMKG
jgi:hypothetical protein